MINKKDVIRINQEVGENGEFSNESSLDFVFSIAKAEKSWLYELSYFVRNILTDSPELMIKWCRRQGVANRTLSRRLEKAIPLRKMRLNSWEFPRGLLKSC